MFDHAKRSLKRALSRRAFVGSGLVLAALGAAGVLTRSPAMLSAEETDQIFTTPLSKPAGALNVFHLGHSLVGRNMPAMLEQISPKGHAHASQLGWGTPLRAHWDDQEVIQGFETENAHPHFRAAKDALRSGDYDAFVLTEMVEIEAAIAYFDSAEFMAKWAELARSGNPDVRIYLYESWHDLNDPQGWLNRLDLDLERYWEKEVLRRSLAIDPNTNPIYVIPAGQVMAQFVRQIENQGTVPGLTSRNDLFQRSESGELDTIHVNDIGSYLVALTHYATLYHRSPVGLPFELTRADGSKMTPITPQAARLMQETVWQVVSTYSKTGIP